MKTTLTALAAVLTTLCIASTALGQTTPPASADAPKSSVADIPQFYYSVTQASFEAPMITKRPESIMVEKGDNAFFQIEFSGHPTPTVYCLHNSVMIDLSQKFTNSDEYIYVVRSGTNYYELLIKDTVIEDSGVYQFEVRNQAGTAMASAKLIVYDLPLW